MGASKIEGLDEGEQILGWMPMSFAGSAASSIRSAFSLRPAKIRNDAIREWSLGVDKCGFPYAGGDMVVGISDQQRLHIWRSKFFVSRPGSHRGWISSNRILEVGVARIGVAARMSLLVDDGTLIGLESMKHKRVRQMAELIRTTLTAR